MVVTHNIQGMNSYRQFKLNQKVQSKSMERLSSGFRINGASDDAAGLSISEKMRFQIRGLDRGAENIQEGISYCQVADGALNEVQDMLHRVTELSIQAANGTLSDSDRQDIMDEVSQIQEEIDRICTTTKYNEDYIFRGEEDEEIQEPYNVSFQGILKDMYIYNETFDSTTSTATYGGIAYNGKRYAWSSIDTDMYDANTNTFRKGTYTLTADDGTPITLVCEEGANPPQVSREFSTTADEQGIYINNQLISWSEVKDASGNSLDKNNIIAQMYSFTYEGMVCSFTTSADDGIKEVIERLSDLKFTTRYNMPTEETAVALQFKNGYNIFTTNEQVKNYLENGVLPAEYTIVADENGLSLADENNQMVAGSFKSWADVGIANWGDQSEDIWNDKIYTYKYTLGAIDIEYSFELINETSKDSVIDALNGVKIIGNRAVMNENHVEVSENSNAIISAEITKDTTNITLQEEYDLGRDYTNVSDVFGNEHISYDENNNRFSVTYTGNTMTKTYSNSAANTNAMIANIKNKILKEVDEYFDIILAKYRAGAKNPTDINLNSLIFSGGITGNGANTYLEEVFKFESTNLKTTLNNSVGKSYAGAKIDFSGLGSTYELADLIGMGFNSTCQTCNNHYSLQFATKSTVNSNAAWQTTMINGQPYQYTYVRQGNDYTLYVDVESMMNNGITDGTEFTNTLVDIMDASGFDFHYTQYATYTDNAELYIFDNRTTYVRNGVSIAKDASFSPYAYAMNGRVDFSLTLYDESDRGEVISINYQYDYKDLFSDANLTFTYKKDNAGNYVYNSSTGQYELYDAKNPAHANMEKYTIDSISFKTGSLETYLESYIKESIFKDLEDTMVTLEADYARYAVSADENENYAMVTTFTAPEQFFENSNRKSSNNGVLKIQYSSNTKDQLILKKYTLSVKKLGLNNLNLYTQENATAGISAVEDAMKMISKIRSSFGAYQNRLEYAYAINKNTQENISASESVIRDTDMEKEVVNLSLSNILAQAGQAMMAQANQSKQFVLEILEI